MSLGASDFLTDEELDELVREKFQKSLKALYQFLSVFRRLSDNGYAFLCC